MNKKKIVNIIIVVFLFCIVGVVLLFINAFRGNPISAAIATKSIKNYVKETYPDMDLEVSDAVYNFKISSYVSKIQSKSSIDTSFTVDWSGGKIYDSYEFDVLGKFTTYKRLSKEFDNKVTEIINQEFPYEITLLIADFKFDKTDFSKLTLDMALDMSNPPLTTYLTVYLTSDVINYEFLSARLLELNKIMEEHQIRVDIYSIIVEEPMENGEKADPNGESIHLYDFPVEKLGAEDLIAAIKEHQKEYEANNSKEKDGIHQ